MIQVTYPENRDIIITVSSKALASSNASGGVPQVTETNSFLLMTNFTLPLPYKNEIYYVTVSKQLNEPISVCLFDLSCLNLEVSHASASAKVSFPSLLGLFLYVFNESALHKEESKGFYPKSFKVLTGQVAKIPPFKDFDIPPPFPTGLDLKTEQESYNFSPVCNEAMDVLDLYETGEWSAASSPCSELFDDIPSPASSLEDSCINDFSIDFTSYLDPAALSTSPDDLCKYLPPKSLKEEEPYLPEVDIGYFSKLPNLAVKTEPKDVSPKLVMSCNNNSSKSPTMVARDSQQKKLPTASSQLKAPTSRTSRKHSSSKRMPEKNTEEYRLKRERNNVAVRKSRFKTKQKFRETLTKVEELTEENDHLHARIDLLTKELNVLRNLFSNPSVFKDQALARALLAQGLADHSS